jgi:glutathione S-transferase
LFLKYKGLSLDTQQIDLMHGEQLEDHYRQVNPQCTVPALVLDDGTVLTEVIGICTYLEELYPEKPLLGTTALEKAEVSSWDHRIFMNVMAAVAGMLRNRGDAFRNRGLPGPLDVPQIPELIERGKLQLAQVLPALDTHLAGSRWLAGENFTFADIDLLVSVDFLAWVKASVPEQCIHIGAWYSNAKAELGL